MTGEAIQTINVLVWLVQSKRTFQQVKYHYAFAVLRGKIFETEYLPSIQTKETFLEEIKFQIQEKLNEEFEFLAKKTYEHGLSTLFPGNYENSKLPQTNEKLLALYKISPEAQYINQYLQRHLYKKITLKNIQKCLCLETITLDVTQFERHYSDILKNNPKEYFKVVEEQEAKKIEEQRKIQVGVLCPNCKSENTMVIPLFYKSSKVSMVAQRRDIGKVSVPIGTATCRKCGFSWYIYNLSFGIEPRDEWE